MIQKKWFRIEHNADGSLGAVSEVDAKGRNGSVVRYYEGADAADACAQAKEWFENYKAAIRIASHRCREGYRAAGNCITCGKRKRVNASHCDPCRIKSNASARRYNRGEAPDRPHRLHEMSDIERRDHVLAAAKRGNERKAAKSGTVHEYAKARVFCKALKESYAFTNLFQFQEWLRAQIRERGLEPPVKPSKKIDWLEDKIAKAAK